MGMNENVTKNSVIVYLTKDGWSNDNATTFCDNYYDLAISKGMRSAKQIAEFVSWEWIWQNSHPSTACWDRK